MKLAIILIILGIAGFGWYRFNRESLQKLSSTSAPTPTTILAPAFPLGWTEAPVQNDQVAKLIKETKTGFQPTIVAIKNDYSGTDPQKYTDKLLKGARSAFPTLRVTSDSVDNTGPIFTRTFTGYYFLKGSKIYFKQTLLIKDNRLVTITASSSADDFEAAFAILVDRQLLALE
ncbi:hypothetical protein M1116_02630 [Patescibacteria group bacterium]|nr:hypothetical protein [Patescibacteria group bacterium]